MTQFEQDLIQSKKIENCFKSHPRYPFAHFKTNKTDEVLLSLFIEKLVHSYINAKNFANWSVTNPYLFTEKDNVLLDIYNSQDNKIFYIFVDDASDPQLYGSQLNFKVFRDDRFFWDKPLEFHTYTLGIEMDLRHPSALEKAHEFMHAFFIEKLSLEQMEKKIELFDQFEGHQFKRKK